MKDIRLVVAIIVGVWGLIYFILGAPKAAVGLLVLAVVLVVVPLLDRYLGQ